MLTQIEQIFRSKTRHAASRRSTHGHVLRLESLEERRMLTIDLSTVVSNLGFEENSALPDFYSQLDRSDSWSQLSGATTDYLHNDGFLSEDRAPQTPSGDGFIGLYAHHDPRLDWFEYAVNALDEPLRANDSTNSMYS